MIDLHLHTTASDGRLSPRALVERVAAAGVTVMAVTDHDTTAAVAEVRRTAPAHGIEVVSGIEVTAVDRGRDVHVLGYFMNPDDEGLAALLVTQRARRVDRVQAMAARLASLGLPIDITPLMAYARRESGRSIGRPQIAQAMIAAGHVRDSREAFDRWLGADGAAFIPRDGPTIEDVIAALHAAGGLASLAHPGTTRVDDRIPSLRDAGLAAIEAFHPDHDERQRAAYASLAASLGLFLTGGSDFHGDPSHGREPGTLPLPVAEWTRLRAAARS